MALGFASLAALLLTAAIAGETHAVSSVPEVEGSPTPAEAAAVEGSPTPAEAAAVEAIAQEPASPPTVVHARFFPDRAATPTRILTEEDLAPVRWRAPFEKAKAKLEAGRATEALGLLAGTRAETSPERYLQALVLNAAGKHLEAARQLVALAADYPALADHCHYGAAVAFERAGDPTAAAGAYDAVEPGSSLHDEAVLGLSRMLRRSGDPEGALAALGPLAQRRASAWGDDRPGEALFAVAELYESLGEREKAISSYFKVWGEHPRLRLSATALERARSLGAEPSAAEKIARGNALMEIQHNGDAVKLLEPIVEVPPEGLPADDLCRARFALGKAFRKLRRHGEAIAMLRLVADECGRDETWARALYVAGTSASIVDRPAGIGFYRRLAEEAPEHGFADDALFYAADLLEREGKPEEARLLLRKLARLYPDGDFRPEGLFKLFWLERSAGRLDEALLVLERIEADYAEGVDLAVVERARYWKARTLVQAERPVEGFAAYQSLVRTHPGSYYAMLARSRLGDQAPVQTLAATDEEKSCQAAPLGLPVLRLAENRRLAAALELMRLGFHDQSVDELLSIDRALLRDEQPAHDLRLLVLMLSRMGKERLAHVVARTELKRDLSLAPNPQSRAIWLAAFPRAYRELIETRSAEVKLDPDLLQGLIREESAFEPTAGSWAGAMGLCQLMMPTAREVARGLKVKGRLTRDRLHEPDLNVQLGSTYLAQLIKRFKGNLALAVASYNAGPGAVNRWLANSKAAEIDEFVEEIPIPETRNYVKRVLGSYSTYQLLYGKVGPADFLRQDLVAAR